MPCAYAICIGWRQRSSACAPCCVKRVAVRRTCLPSLSAMRRKLNCLKFNRTRGEVSTVLMQHNKTDVDKTNWRSYMLLVVMYGSQPLHCLSLPGRLPD